MNHAWCLEMCEFEDMQNQDFFKTLALREKALQTNPALGQVLANSLHDTLELAEIVPLQAQYLVIEVGYIYQHFGFCIFAPAGRTLLCETLSASSGLRQEKIANWLESVCYFLLEDFNILRLVDGEPDWKIVDAVFFREFAKRIICAEPGEFSDLGLDCWSPILTRRLRELAAQSIELARPETIGSLAQTLGAMEVELPYGTQFCESFIACFEEIAANPLRLLVWRVECFTTFADLRQEARIFMRERSALGEHRASMFAALLSLFLPHKTADGIALLPESPLALNQIKTVLSSAFTSNFFDCTLLRSWLEVDDESLDSRLNELVAGALELGLLFHVPLGRYRKGFGLSRSALQILAPFHMAITNSLLKTGVLELPPVQYVEPRAQVEVFPDPNCQVSAESEYGQPKISAVVGAVH